MRFPTQHPRRMMRDIMWKETSGADHPANLDEGWMVMKAASPEQRGLSDELDFALQQEAAKMEIEAGLVDAIRTYDWNDAPEAVRKAAITVNQYAANKTAYDAAPGQPDADGDYDEDEVNTGIPNGAPHAALKAHLHPHDDQAPHSHNHDHQDGDPDHDSTMHINEFHQNVDAPAPMGKARDANGEDITDGEPHQRTMSHVHPHDGMEPHTHNHDHMQSGVDHDSDYHCDNFHEDDQGVGSQMSKTQSTTPAGGVVDDRGVAMIARAIAAVLGHAGTRVLGGTGGSTGIGGDTNYTLSDGGPEPGRGGTRAGTQEATNYSLRNGGPPPGRGGTRAGTQEATNYAMRKAFDEDAALEVGIDAALPAFCSRVGAIFQSPESADMKKTTLISAYGEFLNNVADTVEVEEWAHEITGGEPMLKRDYSAEQRKALGAKGHAVRTADDAETGDYSYPIDDVADLKNAIKAFGRAKPADRSKVKAHIKSEARRLNATDLLPDGW